MSLRFQFKLSNYAYNNQAVSFFQFEFDQKSSLNSHAYGYKARILEFKLSTSAAYEYIKVFF